MAAGGCGYLGLYKQPTLSHLVKAAEPGRSVVLMLYQQPLSGLGPDRNPDEQVLGRQQVACKARNILTSSLKVRDHGKGTANRFRHAFPNLQSYIGAAASR